MVKVNPLTGNAVITGAILIMIFQALLGIVRAWGYQVTGDQEQAIVNALNGPIGQGLAIVITAVVAWVMQRPNVYSLLSLENLTGLNRPEVPPTPPALEVQRKNG